jgi:hypothetical protein
MSFQMPNQVIRRCPSKKDYEFCITPYLFRFPSHQPTQLVTHYDTILIDLHVGHPLILQFLKVETTLGEKHQTASE